MTTEDEMVGFHYQLNGHSLSKLWEVVKDREAWCCSLWGCKVRHDRETGQLFFSWAKRQST